jgi:hypothetical protein
MMRILASALPEPPLPQMAAGGSSLTGRQRAYGSVRPRTQREQRERPRIWPAISAYALSVVFCAPATETPS